MDTLKQSIILFDLDGTLTDSEEGIIRSTQYMQEKMGQRIWSTAVSYTHLDVYKRQADCM